MQRSQCTVNCLQKCHFEPGILVYICHLSTSAGWEVEEGGSGAQGEPLPHRELEVGLGFMRPCLKQTQSCVCVHTYEITLSCQARNLLKEKGVEERRKEEGKRRDKADSKKPRARQF